MLKIAKGKVTIMKPNLDKLERTKVINTIIKEIASRGRKFFYCKDSNVISFFHYTGSKRQRLWYIDKMGGKINPYPSNSHKDYHFSDGGTLWGLIHDFSEYILTGEQTNGKNGYGGLHCPHWGYPEEDMKAIRELAAELGYLEAS